MTGDIREHLNHYLFLAILLLLGLGLFMVLDNNILVRRILAGAIGISYFLWGVVHHKLVDKVTSKIVLEYGLMAVIGYIIINAVVT